MRVWNVLAVLVIVAGGFGAGYLWHRAAAPIAPVQVAQASPTTQPAKEDVDSSLILPAPEGNGVMLDPVHSIVKDHFREMTSLDTPFNSPTFCGKRFQPASPIQQANHQAYPAGSHEPKRSLVRFRLNLEFDFELPTPPSPAPLVGHDFGTLLRTGREVPKMPHCIDEQLPMPRLYPIGDHADSAERFERLLMPREAAAAGS